MRPEKQSITKEYLARLNGSPFFLVVNYKGLKVSHFSELRKRLTKAGADVHVVKNSVFALAAKEAGVTDLNGTLAGQLAVVTGQRDISTAAKAVKTFRAEFDRGRGRRRDEMKGNMALDKVRMVEDLSSATVIEIADLVKELETKWGVTAAAPVAVAAVGGGGGAAAAAPAEAKTAFDVILASGPAHQKNAVIKTVREVRGALG